MDTVTTEQIQIAQSELRILQRALNVAKDNVFQAELRLERMLRSVAYHESQGGDDHRKQLNG